MAQRQRKREVQRIIGANIKTFENWLANRKIDPIQVFINRQEIHGDWLDVNDAKNHVETNVFPGKQIRWEDNDGDLWGDLGKIKILIRQSHEYT